MGVIHYYYPTYLLKARFDDANRTEVDLTEGEDGDRFEATDGDIAAAGLPPGTYTGVVIRYGRWIEGATAPVYYIERIIAAFDHFAWDGSFEVHPWSNFVVGVPVSEIWNIASTTVGISYGVVTSNSVTSVDADRSGVMYIQPAGHLSIESERLDNAEIEQLQINGDIQIYRRMVPNRGY